MSFQSRSLSLFNVLPFYLCRDFVIDKIAIFLQGIARELTGPTATVICASLICTQNIILRGEPKMEIAQLNRITQRPEATLRTKIDEVNANHTTEVDRVQATTVGCAMAALASPSTVLIRRPFDISKVH
jgi:hypothetical protein